MKTFLKLSVTLCMLIVLLFNCAKSSGQSAVSVSTVTVNMINATWASCQIKIAGSPISEKGACCWTSPAPTVSHKKFIASGNNSAVQLTGLASKTKYYVRAFAKSGDNIIYGNELSFTTAGDPPKNNQTVGKKQESKQESIKN
jgi:hypothetical protein